ncbi:MAG: ATP synthase F1 subunit epsilon [Defluviitaleaceae bacterium]|nr:ATP synthase F1 subunit epsilon [Defluviitaleaceae bacterium]
MAEAVDKKIELRVIAPTMATDKSPYKFSKAVDMVIMRCTTGDIGILPGRMPVSMVLGTGVLRIFDEDAENHMALVGGIAHVSDDVVTILSDVAQKPDEVNVEKVTADLEEFRRLYDETTDFNEKKKYSEETHRCQVLLEVAKK